MHEAAERRSPSPYKRWKFRYGTTVVENRVKTDHKTQALSHKVVSAEESTTASVKMAEQQLEVTIPSALQVPADIFLQLLQCQRLHRPVRRRPQSLKSTRDSSGDLNTRDKSNIHKARQLLSRRGYQLWRLRGSTNPADLQWKKNTITSYTAQQARLQGQTDTHLTPTTASRRLVILILMIEDDDRQAAELLRDKVPADIFLQLLQCQRLHRPVRRRPQSLKSTRDSSGDLNTRDKSNIHKARQLLSRRGYQLWRLRGSTNPADLQWKL
ncbi:hypothetical protein FOZ60_011251, partial [Perkinsus olseni]